MRILFLSTILLSGISPLVAKAQTDEQIKAFVKKDYAKERHAESMPSPKVKNVYLCDYNGDGYTDAAAYAVGHNPGAHFEFQSLGLYKNEHGKLRLVAEKTLSGRVSEVSANGNKITVVTASFAESDPMCCPSIKTKQVYTCSNDKIQ